MKFFLSLCLPLMLLANIYEEFSNFAYEKKAGQDFKISDVKLVDFYQNEKFCLQILIDSKEVRVIKNPIKCENLAKDKSFLDFLNSDFLGLYHQDNTALQKKLLSLKKVMRDIMVYYELRLKFDKAMIKDPNISILKLDENGGALLYKINNQTCVGIELFKENKMRMRIYDIENLDKKCKFFISSPAFKELSYTEDEFRLYVLEWKML